MRLFKKYTASILLLAFIFQALNLGTVFAAVYPPQPAPEKLDVKATKPDQPPIGFHETEGGSTGYYVDLAWDALKSPDGMPGANKYINFYLQEINKGYRPAKATYLKERDVPGTSTVLRMKDMASGTFYYVSSRAYYVYNDGVGTFTSSESVSSNKVKVLTDIELNAYSFGTNQIKIEWDDVWDTTGRIGYKLYVSENSTFANTLPIYINSSQIGSTGSIKVNEASGKLEFIHTVRDPGRVYYVKIVPDISDSSVRRSAETRTVGVSSFILAKTTKMSTTGTGTIWRLDWTPVVTGVSGSGVKVTYQIDKYVNDIPIPMMVEDGTTTFITIPGGEEDNYFKIRAFVTKDDDPVYPDYIKIESDKIVVKEQETPSTPSAPELLNEIKDLHNNTIITYVENLTPNSATVLWRAPKKADGTLDTDMTYTIWLITNPNQMDNPPDSTKIASSIKLSQANFVMDESQIMGYKYTVPNLLPNSTYYFKMAAEKKFLQDNGNGLEEVTYASQPALKVIITPPAGPIEQPLVPARPPLAVKSKNNSFVIGEDTVTIQLKNKWYEKFNNGQWEYIRTEKTSAGEVAPAYPDFYNPYDPAHPLDNLNNRVVKYDSGTNGVTVDVGCVEYTEGMDVNELKNMPAESYKVLSFPVTANDPDENPALNAPESMADPLNPIYAKHNINIPITGLKPNTTYIIWVRAARASVNAVSGPSDPILVTTSPHLDVQVEKPIVPMFNYSYAGDRYVDLGWDYKPVNSNPGYKYHIKYGEVDDITKSSGSVTVTPWDMQMSYYRINNLKTDTQYFFWIQAEATSGTTSIKSDWSDSLPLKTLPDVPPSTPRGFGVKNAKDAVTKNSITFEWIKEDNIQYILEITGGIDYKDVKEYTAGSVSEFKVDGLRSNFRYFARLYAYDSAKKLRSAPTQSISVRTERSSDDYDSDQDIENVASGEFIIKNPTVVKGTWNVKITGINADRFIQHIQTDRVLDYKLDVSKPPAKASKISIMISSKVFRALTDLKENLIISTSVNQYVIKPGVLSSSIQGTSGNKIKEFDYELVIYIPGTASTASAKNMTLKTAVAGLEVNAYDGTSQIQVDSFEKPLKTIFTYQEDKWYKQGNTSGIYFDNLVLKWEKIDTSAWFDRDMGKGYLSFYLKRPGNMAVADMGKDFYHDVRGHMYEESINNVASVYDLKSISKGNFEPDKFMITSDAVKLSFEVLGYAFRNDFMAEAAKSGLIQKEDAGNPNKQLTREKAIAMLVRVYELKTGQLAKPSRIDMAMFDDMNKVSFALLSKVAFAAENGIVAGRGFNMLAPKGNITRAEVMVLLEKCLVLLGELE